MPRRSGSTLGGCAQDDDFRHAHDRRGQRRPRPRAEVILKSGGKTFGTLSDVSGKFAFRSPGIQTGTLEIGSGRHAVRRWLTPTAPVTGIELRLDVH